ncbi:hypothetical protein N8544_02285, partial [Akkermansiaceae bacterium]|nr:hypothetical protein [Akkermansiaceae bacterium]
MTSFKGHFDPLFNPFWDGVIVYVVDNSGLILAHPSSNHPVEGAALIVFAGEFHNPIGSKGWFFAHGMPNEGANA